MNDIGWQLERGDMLFIVNNPRHLGRIETVFVNKNSARPNPGGHGIRAHTNSLTFEILWMLDASIGPNNETAMMETTHHKDWQGDIGGAAGPRNHVGGRRHFRNVKFDISDHTAKRLDNRLHLDHIGVNTFKRHAAILDCSGMSIGTDRDLQPRAIGTRRYLCPHFPHVHDRTLPYC
jgi:hypothetical protein